MSANKSTNTLFVLTSFIAVLAILVVGTGVFWQAEGQPFQFRTSRGEMVMIQGHGPFHYDTVFFAAHATAQDVVTLLVGVPLLAFIAMRQPGAVAHTHVETCHGPECGW